MAKREGQLGVRLTDAERRGIRRIAVAESRSESAVVRLLMERGRRLYERDGLLVESGKDPGRQMSGGKDNEDG